MTNPSQQNMSSTTKSHEISESGSSGPGYSSSVEEGVTGSQSTVARTTRTVRVSTPFALSLVRRLAELKPREDKKYPITEDEAANILVSMRPRKFNADQGGSDRGTPSTSETRPGGSPTSLGLSGAGPSTKHEEKIERARRQQGSGRPKMVAVIVSRRRSSTSAVFVPKAKVAARTKKPATRYNTFRTKASKLLGTQTIKSCRNGRSFNSNISTLWREASEEDKAAFGDWTDAEQKEYLIKLAKGPQVENEKPVSTIKKKKGIKAVTRVQPKRGVEGKTKK